MELTTKHINYDYKCKWFILSKEKADSQIRLKKTKPITKLYSVYNNTNLNKLLEF